MPDKIDLDPKPLDKIPTKPTEIPKELKPVNQPGEPNTARLNFWDALNIALAILRDKALEYLDKSTLGIGGSLMKGTLKDKATNYIAVFSLLLGAAKTYFDTLGDKPVDYWQLGAALIVAVIAWFTGKGGDLKPKE